MKNGKAAFASRKAYQPGEDRHHKRLRQNLTNQLKTLRSDGLAHAHLAHAFERAGRVEVHIVNAGDDQDQQCDGRENINRLDISVVPIS